MMICLQGQTLHLLPEKAIYWEERSTLLVSDLHLGKSSHFRKNGIAVPGAIVYQDLNVLSDLIEKLAVKSVYFLGDLFHSDINNEWTIFSKWLELYDDHQFYLIKGNHDILPDSTYSTSNLEVVLEKNIGPFCLTHETRKDENLYNISGHVHPCVRLKGEARQGLRLPCFYFGKKYGLLPAFGNFTGTHPVKVYKDDRVFVIAEGQIIRLSA